jgi:hypothetical protein
MRRWAAMKPGSIASRLDAIFGVDLRALAALRMGVAALTLVDLASRVRDLEAFYTDAGVLPRALAIASAPPGTISLYFLVGGSAAPIGFGFLLHAMAAVAMLLGLRTRLATLATWVLTVSLHSRNPWVLQGADDLLRALLFWSMLLPLGACWSLDSRRSGDASQRPGRFVSLATAGVLIEVAAMYAVTALHKTGAEWQDGSAVWVALAHDHFGRPWAQAMFLPHPQFLAVLGRLVLTVERLAPILLLAPVFTRPARLVALGALVLLQVGFGAMLFVGQFPWVSVVALLPFVPSTVWDLFETKNQAACRTVEGATLASRAVAGSALVYVLAWSAGGVLRGPDSPLGRASAVGVALGLDATWTMFAPEPARDSGWFVIPGWLEDGSVLDLFPALSRFEVERPVTYEKPRRVFEAFPSPRWLDYLMLLTEKNRRDLWLALAAWTCREWNARHPGEERLERLEISFILEEVTQPGAPRPRARNVYFEDACP